MVPKRWKREKWREIETDARDFPGSPLVKTLVFPLQGAQFPYLVWELRSCKPRNVAREREKSVPVLLNTLYLEEEVCDDCSGCCNNGFPPLSAPHSQKQQLVMRTQITRYLEHKVFIAHSGSHKLRQAASEMCAQLPCMGPRMFGGSL